MNMSIDPPLVKVFKSNTKLSQKVSQKVGAWRRSLTYQTENLFPFSFGMFPQVLQGLFRKSRGPSLRVTHLPLAKEVKQHALCSERNSLALEEGALESLKRAAAQLTEFPECISRHASAANRGFVWSSLWLPDLKGKERPRGDLCNSVHTD